MFSNFTKFSAFVNVIKSIVKFEFYNEKRIPQTNSEVTAITQLMAESVLLHYLFSRFSISSATNVFISKNRRRAEIWRSVFPLSTLVNVVRTSKHVTVIFIWYLFSWWKHQAYVTVQHISCTGGWFRDKVWVNISNLSGDWEMKQYREQVEFLIRRHKLANGN